MAQNVGGEHVDCGGRAHILQVVVNYGDNHIILGAIISDANGIPIVDFGLQTTKILTRIPSLNCQV